MTHGEVQVSAGNRSGMPVGGGGGRSAAVRRRTGIVNG